MTPASAPPRVRDRLRTAPDGPVRVLHAGVHALYVEVGGWCVGVVGPGAAQVPCALRVTDMRDIGGTVPPSTAYLGYGKLHVGSGTLSIGRLVGAYVPPLGDGATRKTGPVTVQATPPATVAGLVVELVPRGGIDAAAAARLVGRGEGLTPLGDDVLAGWLAMHRAAGAPTPAVDEVAGQARDRTTLLSATLLDCARHGEVLPEFADWVRTVGTDREPAAVRALHAVGATSGAGLHVGGVLALNQLREAA
ncbi:DUF2877 domain-containing protein [Nocardioides sp. GXQ0305]|uniref:DUF2877 domain-containing protein n=1 Tax=Nocardioides sp. GXQ0305 TaxID=3423912 RepID=UPI003D7EB7A7